MIFRRIFFVKRMWDMAEFGLNVEKKFTLGAGECLVTIILRNPSSREKEINGWGADSVICAAFLEREPTRNNQTIFDAISRGELPSGVNSPRLFPSSIDSHGEIRPITLPRMQDCPPGFATQCRSISKELETQAKKLVSTLRWRLGLDQEADPLVDNQIFELSTDGSTWFPLPSDIDAEFRVIRPKVISNDVIAKVTNIIQTGGGEPLSHSLFHEAWSIQSMNPRSSLLIGVAAAEISIKYYVVHAAPETKWLIENLPSPPIEKILGSYIGILIKDGKASRVKSIPKPIVEELRTAVQLRNEVAHVGTFTLTPESLERKLLAIKDILWLLDSLAGHEWALDHVRPETLKSALS
ncbi:hypothetical protein P12x_002507 [Tundrisphaera lichenicola]|uniref:hypothetical protein n=1 Tax=Tundrisphaera lichenicola TaxID=2029860 RepID=UPI003EBBC722